jgi:hypothetical protein
MLGQRVAAESLYRVAPLCANAGYFLASQLSIAGWVFIGRDFWCVARQSGSQRKARKEMRNMVAPTGIEPAGPV